MKEFIIICFILSAICGLNALSANAGAKDEQNRIYNKCLIEHQNKPYVEAVDTCKERVK